MLRNRGAANVDVFIMQTPPATFRVLLEGDLVFQLNPGPVNYF